MLFSRSLQRLTPALAVGIEIRTLATPNRTISAPITEPHKVESSTMERTPVVPNGDIVDVLPTEPDLQVVVVFQKLLEPRQEHIAFLLRYAVDELAVLADGVQTLPAGDGIGSNDRVFGISALCVLGVTSGLKLTDRFELTTSVLSCPTRLLVKLEATSLSCSDEVRSPKGAGETFEEFLHWRRDAVVQFVSGGPQCVCQTSESL